MCPQINSSVFLCILLLSHSLAHSSSSDTQNNNNNNGPLFGNVMRYFGEGETGGYGGLQSSGLFNDADTNSQVSMCLPNFEVSVGSIIRTKDSQALGAHYLNETDLGATSRDECLRLCCKIPRCNVAVFEEKNSGSCYLFDCGSLEDFRCKFTTQTHYVSAILRKREMPPQHNSNNNIADHSSVPNGGSSSSGSIMGAHINAHSHNQHEDELSQLRNTDKTPAVAAMTVGTSTSNGKSKQLVDSIPHASSSSISSSSGSSTPIPVGLSNVNPAADSHRCSRWQFECKSSGECIAIYNVCDQIPNCPDGSDESPELHCPPNAAYAAGTGDTSVNPNKQKETASLNLSPQQLSPNQQMHHPQPPVPILTAGLEKPNTLNGNGASASTGMKHQIPLRQQDDFSKQQQMTDGGGIVNIPRKNEQGINIFSHKDGGIMDDSFGNHAQQQQMHNNYGQFWKQPPNYDYGNSESQNSNLYGPLPPPPQYPNNGMTYGNGATYGNAQYQYPGYGNVQGSIPQSPQGLPIGQQGQNQYPGTNTFNNVQQQHQQPQQLYYNNNPGQGNNNNLLTPSQAGVQQPTNSRTGGTSQVPQAGIANPSNQQLAPQATTSKPVVNQQGLPIPTNAKNNNNAGKDSFAKLENEFMKSLKAQSLQSGMTDVQSEELSPHSAGAGAVFIFVLGMGMSVVMAIIVGCRLRRVGRRQRGKNRLDPDYLVDGMYL